jgi:hypothetical protein
VLVPRSSGSYVALANLGSESETCVGSRVHLVGVSISFKKNFYQLPFTPPPILVRRVGPSVVKHPFLSIGPKLIFGCVSVHFANLRRVKDEKLVFRT